ncbi:hypothetical protein [Arthrobacter sp. QXT-31]|uniref:hypothetical protein n=1 Tax=Arthrobacter sp. QXT-31 TaxID=1357915 RepID=UPI000971BAA0|nr:hypothetical protein [Arthrobacter sp. QXT-31]APX03380.1 hypothetical protein BWQ92_18115 [Arthrobacter sp. QXT-31]
MKENYWNGEGMYCFTRSGQELPTVLVPADYKATLERLAEKDAERRQQRAKGPNYTAEDIDARCTEAEERNA